MLAQPVADADPAIPLPGGLLVTVLETPDPLAIAVAYPPIAIASMDARNLPLAIAVHRHRPQESRAYQVGKLKPGVIVAMAEGRRLYQARICIAAALELLREDRMARPDILVGRPAVDDDEAPRFLELEPMLKMPADILQRRSGSDLVPSSTAEGILTQPANPIQSER